MFKTIFKNKSLFFLLLGYAFINNLSFARNTIYLNYLNPLFWGLFIICNYHQETQSIQNQKIVYQTLIIAFMFLLIYYGEGFIFGFTHSPFNHSLSAILTNIITNILPLFGIELIRYQLIKNNKNNFVFINIVTLIIIFIELDITSLLTLPKTILFQHIFSSCLPIIAKNILFTYLTYHTNYKIPLLLQGFEQITLFLLPIIPYNNWFIKGSFAMIKVVVIYFIFKYFIFPKRLINHQKRYTEVLIYTLTLLISTFLVSFMLGLFKYECIAILSNSMAPTLKRGDIVIYDKKGEVNNNSIIVFNQKNQIIVHRVVNQSNDFYITKGDANNTTDKYKVRNSDIKGVYKFHLKYLGYPAIWLNEFLNRED